MEWFTFKTKTFTDPKKAWEWINSLNNAEVYNCAYSGNGRDYMEYTYTLKIKI